MQQRPMRNNCPYENLSRWRRKKKKKEHPELESIRLQPPLLSVRPSLCPKIYKDVSKQVHRFPLSASKIFFTDRGARSFFYDTDLRCVVTAPSLHAPKKFRFALSTPSHGEDGDDDSLYIMESCLEPNESVQFEALVFRQHAEKPSRPSAKTWHCDALPLPPYVHDPAAVSRATVVSYAVVGDTICISAMDVGTYCFDTASREWSRAGDWLMPFYGKAEYVLELKLWFGISGDDHQLPCVADLSPVVGGNAPGKARVWGDPDVPEEWHTSFLTPTNMVSLGSGRFCITNFFQTMELSYGLGELVCDQKFAVFTGLEVIAGNRKGNGTRNVGYV